MRRPSSRRPATSQAAARPETPTPRRPAIPERRCPHHACRALLDRPCAGLLRDGLTVLNDLVEHAVELVRGNAPAISPRLILSCSCFIRKMR